MKNKKEDFLKENQEVQHPSNRGYRKTELKTGRKYQRSNTQKFPRTEGHESFH